MSLISDFFGDNQRGTATGIFHWGVYFGYGLSYAVGVYVTASNMFGLGWRMCYLMAGIPGFSKFSNLVCFLFMTKVRAGILGFSKFNNLHAVCFLFISKHCGMEVRAGIPGLSKFSFKGVFFLAINTGKLLVTRSKGCENFEFKIIIKKMQTSIKRYI